MPFVCNASEPSSWLWGWKIPKVRLTHKEAKTHSLLVYGGAYYQLDMSYGDEVATEYSGYVYMVIDRNTDTFMWLDCSNNKPNRQHTLYGECRISNDTLYVKPKYSSLIDENGIRQFDDSIGMIYYNIDAENHIPIGEVDADNIPSSATPLSEYKFLISKKSLVNITGLLYDESEFFRGRYIPFRGRCAPVLPNMKPGFHPAWNLEVGCISDFKIQWVKLHRIKLPRKMRKVDGFFPNLYVKSGFYLNNDLEVYEIKIE